MRELTANECEQVTGGFALSGYDGATAIIAATTLGSLFSPIGPITGGIAIGSAAGLAIAQYLADLEKDDGGS